MASSIGKDSIDKSYYCRIAGLLAAELFSNGTWIALLPYGLAFSRNSRQLKMTFLERYLTATKVFDAGHYVEALNLYQEILETNKEKLFELMTSNDGAYEAHIRMTSQFAVHKCLVQRMKGQSEIELDVSLFSSTWPFRVRYGGQTVEHFFSQWKDTSPRIQADRARVKQLHRDIQEKYMKGTELPEPYPSDVYFSHWIAPDLIQLSPVLPNTVNSIVSIGCGAGLFEAVYLRNTQPDARLIGIDTDESCGPAFAELMQMNGIRNADFQTQWEDGTEEPQFVLSIRSCGFMYDVDVYDSLFRRLGPGSRVVLDIAPARKKNALKYFQDLGAAVINHTREWGNFQTKEFVF